VYQNFKSCFKLLPFVTCYVKQIFGDGMGQRMLPIEFYPD